MTSHYVRCVVKNSFEKVSEALNREFGNVYIRKFGETGASQSGIVLGEHCFRAEHDAAVLITLEAASASETKIEIISCAGGKGCLRHLSWSSFCVRV